MISYFQAIILGILQGFAELFPISSLGHTVLLPRLFNWNIDRGSGDFLSFLVLTHFATALVLVGFFWRDWLSILGGLLRIVTTRSLPRGDVAAQLGMRLIISTIPAGILGLLFQHRLEAIFASTSIVAACLMLNGLVLLLVDWLTRNAHSQSGGDTRLSKLSFLQSFLIGVAQSLALIPGFSRTGLAMTGGLLSNLSHEDAARYSFLMATPVIFAAAVLKVPGLLIHGVGLGPAFTGSAFAALSAFLSVKFLLKYFEGHKLTAFALYCLIAGALALVLL